jgi:hypothetical protein
MARRQKKISMIALGTNGERLAFYAEWWRYVTEEQPIELPIKTTARENKSRLKSKPNYERTDTDQIGEAD